MAPVFLAWRRSPEFEAATEAVSKKQDNPHQLAIEIMASRKRFNRRKVV